MAVRIIWIIFAAVMMLMVAGAQAQEMKNAPDSTSPQLLVIGTAHLDTQWRWTIQESIGEFIPDTFRRNIALMMLYPDYVFSFEGAFRYILMKEYYPDEFEQVRPFVNSGQWRVTGSWVDAVDVNIPSFESLVRHTLYGNGYFKREFGKISRDIFLPDCFGFGYALPSIAVHSGLRSISTQKLTWGGCVGVPFDIGIWEGVDGSTIVAALNPGSYGSSIEDDLTRDTTWIGKARRQGDTSGLYAAYRYFGTGDTGGSPDSASVDWLEISIHSDGPLKVVSAGADDLADLAASVDRDRLPHYNGELVMTRHGVGCYTSQAAMKRWNRKNEQLADAAERASVIAHRFGSIDYPRDMLRDTWIRFLWHQFHDDLTGTSVPEAYEFSWNDEILCQNRFAALLEHAVASTAPALDTRCEGIPLVVYNPLSIDREDIVEATVYFPDGVPSFIRVYDPDGNEVAADLEAGINDSLHIRFPAKVPPVGYAVYDVRPSEKPCEISTGLKITDRMLENERYRVTINDSGDVSSIFDKQAGKELLAGPIRFEFLTDTPNRWPAWEIDYDDIMETPRPAWVGPANIRIKENGRARIAIEIERKTDASTVRSTIRLAAGGASSRVEFDTEIDWYERETLLKVSVPVTTPNDSVWYDLGLGAIKRGLNHEKLYEVPGHQWADLSSPDGDYGVAVLNDCRYGWDHPSPGKLRLTLVHTPGVADGWDWVTDEKSQDNGRHHLLFAVQGHSGDWRQSDVVWQAARINQPLAAFQTSPHHGRLGKRYSLLNVESDSPQSKMSAMVNAVKLAEDSDEIVVRVRELMGEKHERVTISFDRPVIAAREINGGEEAIGPAMIENGQLVFSLTPFQPKAFAATLASADVSLKKLTALPVHLPYNIDGISLDDDRCNGNFDGHGRSLAGELIPDTLIYCDIPFVFGPKTPAELNTVTCRGQVIELPKGTFNRLYLLAAAVDGPGEAAFNIDNHPVDILLQDYSDPIGQWNNRLADGILHETPEDIAPAYINRMPVAWYGSHRHTSECENDLYRFTYLFLVELDLPPDVHTLTLPSNDRIRVMAATLADSPYDDIEPVRPLNDETRSTLAKILADSAAFAGSSVISIKSPIPGTAIRYTLDGTRPTIQSSLYTEPFTVTNTTTIKARGMKEGAADGYVAAKTVSKLTLRDPVQVNDPTNGLNSSYYEGEWERMPDFDSVAIAAAFTADTIAIPDLARDENYGLVFKGYINIPHDGVYALSISSDDGSRLYVADSLLVDNDGLHGDYEMTGLIGLKAGYHRITAFMFQHEGGEALSASVAGPSLPKQPISADMLYRER